MDIKFRPIASTIHIKSYIYTFTAHSFRSTKEQRARFSS